MNSRLDNQSLFIGDLLKIYWGLSQVNPSRVRVNPQSRKSTSPVAREYVPIFVRVRSQ